MLDTQGAVPGSQITISVRTDDTDEVVLEHDYIVVDGSLRVRDVQGAAVETIAYTLPHHDVGMYTTDQNGIRQLRDTATYALDISLQTNDGTLLDAPIDITSTA